MHIAYQNPSPDSQSSSPATANNERVLGSFKDPRAPARRSTSSKVSKAGRLGRASKQSVLVVDDVVDVTEMIALFLKHAGYDVTTANSAEKALEFAETQAFDLIISDIGMPEKNGYELAEALRALADYQTTPLIAVTGYTEYDDRGRSLRAGFDAHLTKPINPSQLLELVGKLIG